MLLMMLPQAYASSQLKTQQGFQKVKSLFSSYEQRLLHIPLSTV